MLVEEQTWKSSADSIQGMGAGENNSESIMQEKNVEY
jgi:hypothetical protein